VWRNGLRVYEPQWPFFPPFDDDAKSFSTDLIKGLRTVAVQASQFMGHADRFLDGSVSMRFDSSLRPGQFIDVNIPAKGDGLRLSAYVERVSHRVWVEAKGQVMARTTAVFSRGLVQEKMDRGQQFLLSDPDKKPQGGTSS
jgi:hypothetical protein